MRKEKKVAKEPRDMRGDNPTGREIRSSAGKRRQAVKREAGRKAMEQKGSQRG